MTLASFATSMRATSLAEDLNTARIAAEIVKPKWINKRLPPPRVEVRIDEADADRAKPVLAAFNNEGKSKS